MADQGLPDPLLILRLALSSSLPITLISSSSTEVTTLIESSHISFPSLPLSPKFPKSISTRFFARPNLDHSDPNSPSYDLQTLFFSYLRREDSTGDYLKGCRNQGVGFVSTTDRKLVVEYLNGKTPVQGPDTRIRSLNDQEKELTRKVIPDLGQEGQDSNELMGGRGGDFTTGKRDVTQRGDESGSTTTTGGATGGDVNNSSGSGGNLQPPPMKKARYTPDKLDQEKVKKMLAIMEGPTFNQSSSTNLHEQQASSSSSTTKIDRLGGGAANHTRETVLRGERYNNFDSVRSLISPRLQALQASLNSSSSSKPSTSSTSAASSNQPGALKPIQSSSSKKKQLNPIIMISPSSTALITMHNVKDFLQDSKFIPSDQAKLLASSKEGGNSGGGYLAEDVVQINHARANTGGVGIGGGKTIETRQARYFIVDSVEALAKFGGPGKEEEAWDRVVCVMTTGQEWQFNKYKWKEPKELFHHVKGIYPQWARDPTNPKIKAWNVSELRIDPHKRHIDKSVVADFWRNLETWIGTNKPWLSY